MKRTVLTLAGLFGLLGPVFVGIAHSQNIYDAVLAEAAADTPNISTGELINILEDRSAIVVDVRTYDEYAISHIPGAVNVSGKSGSTREEFTSDATEIGRLVDEEKSAPIVIYCAGPHCGKARRVADDLLSLGYSHVSRYQLGIPVWRALGGVTEIEMQGILHVLNNDQTAVFIDARNADQFGDSTLDNAQNIQARFVVPEKGGKEVANAKEDGRLPMQDHNTRVIVFGQDMSEAKKVAEALSRNAFHNVSFFAGSFSEIRENTDD